MRRKEKESCSISPQGEDERKAFLGGNHNHSRQEGGQGMLEGGATLQHSTLPFFGTGNGGGQAEQYVDAPGDVALGLLEAHASSEKLPNRRAKQGVEAI